MKRLTNKRPSPAMIVAFVALFASVVGTATALPGRNTVDKNDLKKGAVQPSDIRRRAVTSSKIGLNAVTTSKVLDDNLTGADIIESTLGPVPELAWLKRYSVKIPFGGDVELASNGSVSVRAACVLNGSVNGVAASDGVAIYARTTAAGSFMSGSDDHSGDTTGDGPQDAETLDPGDAVDESTLFYSTVPGGAPDEQRVVNDIDDGWILGADGSYIGVDGETTMLGIRALGSDCAVAGSVTLGAF